MTTTPPEAPPTGPDGPGGPTPDEGPRVTAEEVRDLGRLRRSRTDRKVAGVAGGLARHLDVDPVILRVAFVVLVFFGGAGLILYAACWLLVPEEGARTAPLHLDDRSRSVALVIAGVIALAALVGHSLGRFGFPWPLAVVALIGVLYLTRRDARRASHTHPADVARPDAPPAPWAGAEAATDWQQPPAAPAATGWPSDTGWQSDTAWQSATGWQPVAPMRGPRRRGPKLFWFTLALVALAVGVLGTIDLAGASLPSSAYPALALGITGAMLLLGAFWGRAGGLILLGLLSAAALGVTSTADHWEGTNLRATPSTADAVRSHYSIPRGDLVLDLSKVADLRSLDGRTINLKGDLGQVEVVLPAGLGAEVEANVHGPGHISLFGEETGGFDVTMERRHPAGAGAPLVHLDAELAAGQIEVTQR
jgi:phage shock protein PspC (stress-responsive transcriptional regulator)